MILACIALPFSLFAYQGYTSYLAMFASADLEIARTRDIAREHAVKVLETIERSLSEVNEIVRGRSDDDIRANEPSIHQRLKAIDTALTQMKSVWVIAADGKPLATSLSLPVPPSDYSDRDYFTAHIDRDIGTYLGHVLVPRPPFGGAAFFSISRRRASDDGSFTGILQASVLPDYFEQFYGQIGFEPGALIILARADGTVLASHPPLPQDTLLAAGGPLGRQIALSPEQGLISATFLADGLERRVAYQKLAGYPVYVAAGLTSDAIFDRWERSFGDLLTIAIPGTLLLFVILILFFQSTKRLYAESAHRERAEAALRDNQRLEALGRLTGGVAHDFNNLLTIIGSSADLLRRPALPEERRVRYVNAISETVTRATGLTAQLLAFARRQPLAPEIFDAGARLDSMAGVLQTLAGSTVLVRVTHSGGHCVEADASQFETAIINLVANARDAMPGGGEALISARLATALPDRLRETGQPADFVAISVADSGVGIAPDQLTRVFEPFFTTKEVGRGTGLGLSQVFGFARQSRGEVAVESVPGQGATFTLFLPRAAAKAPAPPSPPQAEAVGLHVLLVDDNAALLEATAEALRARGLTVVTCQSGAEALAAVKAGARVDAVLTDVVMPGISGLELALTLRERAPHLPVVLTTGYSEEIERGLADDMTLVRKPYVIDDLVARLGEAVKGAATASQ